MPAKAKKKAPARKKHDPAFLGITEEEVLFKRDTLEAAKSAAAEMIESGKLDTVTIVCIVGAWVVELPPEPCVEMAELDLGELVIDEET